MKGCGSAAVAPYVSRHCVSVSALKRPLSLNVASTAFTAAKSAITATTLPPPPPALITKMAIIPDTTNTKLRITRPTAATRLLPKISQSASAALTTPISNDSRPLTTAKSRPQPATIKKVPSGMSSAAMTKNAIPAPLMTLSACSRVVTAVNHTDFVFPGNGVLAGRAVAGLTGSGGTGLVALRGNSGKSSGSCQFSSPSRQTSASAGKPSAVSSLLTSSVEKGPLCKPPPRVMPFSRHSHALCSTPIPATPAILTSNKPTARRSIRRFHAA